MQHQKYGGIISTEREEQYTNRLFWSLFVLSQVFGVLTCFLIGFWISQYAPTTEKEKFNRDTAFPAYPNFSFHPLFMTLSMVFLLGEGALIHRLLRPYLDPRVRVSIHLLIMLTAFCLAVVGTDAVFKTKTAHMGSVHTWIGLLVLIAFTAQGLLGFLAFYFPGAAPAVHRFYRSVHRFFGLAIFGLAGTAALMGMSIVGIPGHIMSTALVLSIAAYVITVMALVAHPDFVRTDYHQSEESSLITRGRTLQ